MVKEGKKVKCKRCGNKYLCESKKCGCRNHKNHLERCKPYVEFKSKNQTKTTFEHGGTW